MLILKMYVTEIDDLIGIWLPKFLWQNARPHMYEIIYVSNSRFGVTAKQ